MQKAKDVNKVFGRKENNFTSIHVMKDELDLCYAIVVSSANTKDADH